LEPFDGRAEVADELIVTVTADPPAEAVIWAEPENPDDAVTVKLPELAPAGMLISAANICEAIDKSAVVDVRVTVVVPPAGVGPLRVTVHVVEASAGTTAGAQTNDCALGFPVSTVKFWERPLKAAVKLTATWGLDAWVVAVNVAENVAAGMATLAGTGKFALLELVTATDAAEAVLCENVMVQSVVAVAFAAMAEGAHANEETSTARLRL
jgi:hypothetical protein